MSATELLQRSARGDATAAEALLPLLYEELREVAQRQLRNESPGHTLQPTALVHEAWLRLVPPEDRPQAERGHYLALAARVIRNVLVDHARAKKRRKRGGDRRRVTLDTGWRDQASPSSVDVLALSEALNLLSNLHPRQAQVVELRYFGGLTMPEVASEVGVSLRTAEADWRVARAFLHGILEGGGDANA